MTSAIKISTFTLDRVAKSPVAGGNNDLKKISADREMGRIPRTRHRGHTDVASTAAKNPLHNPPTKATSRMIQSEMVTPDAGNEIIGGMRQR